MRSILLVSLMAAAGLLGGTPHRAWAADVPAAAGEKTAATPTRGTRLEWLEYGEALDRAEKDNKHVLVDFYTTWCGWCKVMDRNTYGDSTVAAYLRDHFVVSKVNAESPKRFRVGLGTKSGIELAREYGINSFPITWFLKPDGSRLDKIMGYVKPDAFRKALVYVHEREYQKGR